jgi:hypothetical protein
MEFTPVGDGSVDTRSRGTFMRNVTAFTLLALLSATASRGGDVYRWIDAQGQPHYSDTPVPGAVLIATTGTKPSTEAPPASPPSSGLAKSSEPISQQLAQDAAKRAVDKDVAQKRSEQCKQAQDKYQQMIDARRVFRTGKDGEREYLSDEETEQARLNARIDMESVCGKQ